MAKMSNEEWAQHTAAGLHLREDQRTEQQKQLQAAVAESDGQKLDKIVKLLSTIKNMVKFFTVLAVIALVLAILSVVGHIPA